MGIKIKQPLGVCGVCEDTKTLAELALFESRDGWKALDIGTGTGYIAICLAKHGVEVDATDINEQALAVAKENAALNNVHINIFHSNLFEKIDKKYDLIVFNPPVGNAPDGIKSFARKLPLARFLAPLYISLSMGRKKILSNFFKDAAKHITPKGKIIITAPAQDIGRLAAGCGLRKIKQIKKKQDFVVLTPGIVSQNVHGRAIAEEVP